MRLESSLPLGSTLVLLPPAGLTFEENIADCGCDKYTRVCLCVVYVIHTHSHVHTSHMLAHCGLKHLMCRYNYKHN